jgi:predicted alpha-1,6-mannanase (GH76 family)
VTVGLENGAVPYEPSRTGICLVRIEAQDSGVLITLRTNADVEQVSTEQVLVVADINAAVQVVREFLTEFTVVSKGH